ncbi:acyl-CoA desaturase 1-like [Panonychus citri]|uniref:acyl-CoA desaturase 1-like n=1 Tax=Panonychus citri TaxID=50023 RepID=UPI002306F4D4|nr:acyl-CoA desaturase 1-like [Panonychus citri]
MCRIKSLTTGDPNDPIVNKINQQSKELLTKSSDSGIYLYINKDSYGIVWKNVIVFTILHLLTIYATIVLIRDRVWNTWIFAYLYGFLGGLGVTAGAHRLWSHRSYKAKFSLRLFLACCFSIAGQNDLLTWCRDHRVHHKFSETDSDPHNSRRGFFFAHVGWLLTRKHPSVIADGKKVDLSDLMDDPIVRYHRRFYPICYVVFIILIPWFVPVCVWSESISTSLLIAVIWRYVTSLHCTWFVNSAAHMWGDRPYRSTIGARENYFVSFAAFGEGFHNFHHSFPWDYATSELGWKLNPTKVFIDLMSKLGLAYDLKTVKPETILRITDKHHQQK